MEPGQRDRIRLGSMDTLIKYGVGVAPSIVVVNGRFAKKGWPSSSRPTLEGVRVFPNSATLPPTRRSVWYAGQSP